jgi:hypothetical protein
MKHLSSVEDQTFRQTFEACQVPPAEFNHRAHLRLAYVYLTEQNDDTAYQSMRNALFSFLRHHGVDIAKYHDTMTRAWVMAVRHFMENTPESESFEAFIELHPVMLDTKIMLTHYSAEVLFSAEARAGFVTPDLESIPVYGPVYGPIYGKE